MESALTIISNIIGEPYELIKYTDTELVITATVRVKGIEIYYVIFRATDGKHTIISKIA